MSESELATEPSVLIIRQNLLARHRYITGALWFGICAFVAAYLVSGRLDLGGGLSLPGLATLSALLPGSLLGAKILDFRAKRSVWGATWRGAVIVLISHVLFTMGMLFSSLMTSSSLSVDMASLFGIMFLGMIFGGWMTLPIGCVGAVTLHILGRREIRPKGCAIHRYRG